MRIWFVGPLAVVLLAGACGPSDPEHEWIVTDKTHQPEKDWCKQTYMEVDIPVGLGVAPVQIPEWDDYHQVEAWILGLEHYVHPHERHRMYVSEFDFNTNDVDDVITLKTSPPGEPMWTTDYESDPTITATLRQDPCP